MIRIGRGSKPETNEEANESMSSSNVNSTPSYRSSSPSATPTTGQPMTESETMARDIKEGRLSGYVGSGTVLTGETNFQAMLRVDGHLTGTVTSDDGTLIVGTNGRVDANVNVAVATINGIVNGDIIATEKLELGRTAKVAGNVHAPRLMIEDGAVFEGSCSMLKAQEELEERKTEAAGQSNSYEQKSTTSEYSSYKSNTVSVPDDPLELDDDDDDEVDADDADADEEETAEAAII